MTQLIFILVVLVVMYFDLSVLRKQDETLFRKIFSFPAWLATVYPVWLFGLLALGGSWDNFMAIFFLFVFPIYLLRRRHFRKTFAQNEERSMETGDSIPGSRPAPSSLILVADAIGLLWTWFFGMLAIILIIEWVGSSFPALFSELDTMILIAVASSMLLIILIYRTLKRYPQLTFTEAIALRRGDQSWHKIVTIPAILGIAVAAVSSFLIFARDIQPSTPMSDVLEANNTPATLLVFMVMAVLFAPVLEEMIFRGYFFYVLSRYRGQTFTIYFIAIIFALLHVEQYWGDWLAIAMVGALGLVLSYLRVWTKTTLATIVTHFFYNGTMTVLPIILVVTANPTYFQYQSQYYNLDFNGKEKLLLQSIEGNPKFSDSYNDLAWLYAEANVNLEEALVLAERALHLSPGRFAYLDTKAEVLYKMERYKEAIDIAKDLVRRYPKEQYMKEQLKKFRAAVAQKRAEEIAGEEQWL